MRIASLLPSATEIAFALGLGDQVVAVSHECDYPPEASGRPVLTKSAIHQKMHRSLDVDREVEKRRGDIYEIDEKLLGELKPDLILTQELCAVCAVSYTKVKEAARVLDADTKIVSLEPNNLEEIVDNIRLVGKITGKTSQAEELASRLSRRIDKVKEKTKKVQYRPRVFFMEWLEPPWAGGHWIGFDLKGVKAESHVLASYPGWDKIPAYKSSRIYAVNASAYFSRPGPRVVDGLELLAHIIHPELYPENPPDDSMERLDTAFIKA